MAINIETNAYNGPMELLLNLIDKKKIDIYDIKISDITDSYLEEMEKLTDISPEEMTDFVFMASTLILIKSRTMLPKNEFIQEDEEEITEEVLLQRLMEYRKFKILSKNLLQLKEDSKYCLGKIQEDMTGFVEDKPAENAIIGDAELLFKALVEIITREQTELDNEKSFDILRADEYSVEKYIENIQWKMKKDKRYTLRELLENTGEKKELIVVFLSVLEMIKTKTVRVYQDSIESDIYIELR